jgi:hypothetical protein
VALKRTVGLASLKTGKQGFNISLRRTRLSPTVPLNGYLHRIPRINSQKKTRLKNTQSLGERGRGGAAIYGALTVTNIRKIAARSAVYFNGSSCFSGGSLGPCIAGVRIHFSLELSLTRGLWRERSFRAAVDVAVTKAELLLTHWRGSPLVAARGGNEYAVRCEDRLSC